MLPEQALGLGAVFMMSLGAMNAVTPGYTIAKFICSAALTAAVKYKFLKYSGPRRRMSYSSAQLVTGPFPPESKVPDPIINALLYFDEAPTMDSLIELAEKHLLPYERFSSVPVMAERGACVWQNVHVHPKDHFYKHFVNNAKEAHDLVTEISSRPLNNPLLPRWEFHLVVNRAGTLHEGDTDPYISDKPFPLSPGDQVSIPSSQTGVNPQNYRQEYGVKAPKEEHILVFRINHAIGDGIAIVSVFYQFLCDVNGVPLRESQDRFTRKRPSKPSIISTVLNLIKALLTVLSMPNVPYDTRTSFNPNGASIDVATIKKDKENELSNHQGARARFQNPSSIVFVPRFSLDMIKQLKNVADVTVNDICVAATAGAIRRYCISQNDTAFNAKHNFGHEIKCTMLLPVAFPRSSTSVLDPYRALRNVFSFAPAILPIHIESIRERLALIKKNTTDIKSSFVPLVALKSTELMNAVLPQPLSQATGADTFSKRSVIFSNVPGPDCKVIFAGKEVKGMQMVYPNLITQIGIISYNGIVNMNFTLDAVRIPNAQLLGDFMIEELHSMCEEFGVKYIPCDA